MLREIYLTKFGVVISLVLNVLSIFHKPFMVYGYFDIHSGRYRKFTRIGSSVKLLNKKNIFIEDNVWIGQYCLLDGIGGIHVGEGVHLASHTCIYTHSSQDSIRLLGKQYIRIENKHRPGYRLSPVKIGEYSFVGTSCVILPGVEIGRGCIVGAGSIVKDDVPDFSVAVGNPAVIVGTTERVDTKFIDNEVVKQNYFDQERFQKLSDMSEIKR